ncbi:hypothetical protein AWJ20_2021 [Sugiyamaella lignohabitans]|uniref:Kinetochore protein mis13 n=1 Tax=Sugiyamaella lignohabitans TaxID=796027 RepID=A0A167ETF4_9ASCO|nr:uncharacterized protein AWJ20_2021 [Sugiyamaella lignohabitans]ANB14433.1 hypothetical protein AWJ20_2021 [Sugiyamaella lignohabitans]
MARPRKSDAGPNGSDVSGQPVPHTTSSNVEVTNPPKKKRGRPRKSVSREEDDGFVFKRLDSESSLNSSTAKPVSSSKKVTTLKETVHLALEQAKSQSISSSRSEPEKAKKIASKSSSSQKHSAHSSKENEKQKKRSQREHDHAHSKDSDKRQKLSKMRPRDTTSGSAIATPPPSIPSSDNHDSQPGSYDDSIAGRTSTTQVLLHDQETPVIRRNQKLRNQTTTGKRRSSLSNRGKRLSNIGNGYLADPHSDVDARDFSKHLDENLSDVQRLKQVLLWCLKRNLEVHGEDLKRKRDQSTKSTSEELTALTIARQIFEEEVVKNLVDGKISIDWHSRPENAGQANVKRIPNSLNVTAQNNLTAFQKRLEELEREKEELERNLQSVGKSRLSKERLDNLIDDNILNTLDDQTRRLFLEYKSSSTPVLEPSIQLRSFRENLPNVEVGVTQLRDGVHKIESITKAASIFIDKTMKKLSEAAAITYANNNSTQLVLTIPEANSDADRSESSLRTPVSPHDILRAISRLES